MTYEISYDMAHDPTMELTLEEWIITNLLSKNFMKWLDPEETMLGWQLSSHWNKLRERPLENLGGKTVTLLEHLHMK